MLQFTAQLIVEILETSSTSNTFSLAIGKASDHLISQFLSKLSFDEMRKSLELGLRADSVPSGWNLSGSE